MSVLYPRESRCCHIHFKVHFLTRPSESLPAKHQGWKRQTLNDYNLEKLVDFRDHQFLEWERLKREKEEWKSRYIEIPEGWDIPDGWGDTVGRVWESISTLIWRPTM